MDERNKVDYGDLNDDKLKKVHWENDEPPKDLCGERRCFAYDDGQCDILNDTDFGTGICPFFKTRKEYRAGLEVRRKKCADTSSPSDDDFLSANAGLMDEIAELNAEADRIERG